MRTVQRATPKITVAPGNIVNLEPRCLDGEVATGGGYIVIGDGSADVSVGNNHPNVWDSFALPTAWLTWMKNNESHSIQVQGLVICLDV